MRILKNRVRLFANVFQKEVRILKMDSKIRVDF